MRMLHCWLLPAILATSGALAQVSANEPLTVLRQAVQAFQAGNVNGAIGLLEPLLGQASTPPPVYGMLGLFYLEAGRAGDALEILEPLAEAESADPAVLYNAGRASLALGRSAQGEAYLERSVRLEANTPASRELGLLRGGQGQTVDAYVLLRPWVLAHPDDSEARLAAAFCAVKLGRAPEAEELLSALSREDPKVTLLWGRLLLIKGDPHGALATLEPLLEDAPSEMDRDVRRTMAKAYMIVGQAADAATLLEGRTQGDPVLTHDLAEAQYQAGNLETAMGTIGPLALQLVGERGEAVQEADPQLAGEVALLYGSLLLASARREEALPYLEIASRHLPDSKQAWQSLGQALAAMGRREEAKVALARFQEILASEVPPSARDQQLRQDLEDPTGRQIREALRLLKSGRAEEGLALLENESQLTPDDARPKLLESRFLLVLERLQEALDAAERAVQTAPQNADAYYQRGVVLIALEDRERAESDLRRALQISPQHTAAMSDLAMLLIMDGERDEARRLLERVLELRPEDTTAAQALDRLEQQ